MRSTNNYPVWEEKRNELDIRPLMYKKKKGKAYYILEGWRERHWDIKYKAMCDQKREPMLYVSRNFIKALHPEY